MCVAQKETAAGAARRIDVQQPERVEVVLQGVANQQRLLRQKR